MSHSALLLILGLLWQTPVPFKPNEDFEIKLDYSFQLRQYSDNLQIDYERNESSKKTATGSPLPYLVLRFKILKLTASEIRVKITTNKGKVEVSKKVEVGDSYKLDLGFTDDVKDFVTANEYTITFSDAEKKDVSRVFIEVLQDGTFLVNNQKRGKF